MNEQSNAQAATWTTSPLSPGDLDAVVAIDRALGGVSRRGFFEKRLAAALEDPGDFVYVGLRGHDGLVGYAFARMVAGEFGKPGARAGLDSIGVAPGHQGRSAGRLLLAAVEEVLRHKGVDELTSQVEWTNPALLGFFGKAGFTLAPRIVLTRPTDRPMDQPLLVADDDDQPLEVDYSSSEGDDFDALSRDLVPVRSMTASDLDALVSIDRRATGADRNAYYRRKQREALRESGVRVSLVAEQDEHPVGFIMARVDYGEFGHTSPEAVMDTIGVDPGHRGRGVGQALMSQLIANLATLRVDHITTELEWNDVGLIDYLDETGFAPAQRVVLGRKI